LTVLSRGPTQHGEGQLAAAEPHSVLHLAVVKLGRQTDPAVNIFTHNQTMLRCYRQLASCDFRLQLYFSFSHVDEKYYNSVSVLKVKVHTLDIAPLHSELPPQKRSSMAYVLKGFHSFTCTPTRSSAIGMSHTCLCLPSHSWYSFTDPRWMEG